MIDVRTAQIHEIVTQASATAQAFERFGLDFCCGGRRTIAEACDRKGIDPEEVFLAVESTLAAAPDETDVASWDADRLIDHIETAYHMPLRAITPVLLAHSRKVARVHGDGHPETERVAAILESLLAGMEQHTVKEEMILFPHIRSLAAASRNGGAPPDAPFGTVRNPIGVMEGEHDAVGARLAELQALTNDFTPPADACATYRVCYDELARFVRETHRHIHLENYVLHPMALKFEEKPGSSVHAD